VLWPPLASIVSRVVPVETVLPTLRVAPERAALAAAARSTGDWVTQAAIALWIIASLVLVVRLLRAAAALRVVRRQAEQRVVDGVPVLLTDRVGPATVGLRRHAVLVPRDLLDLEEPLRRIVLRHEREHCEAHDPRLVLAAAIAVVLVPWNVALWYVAQRLRLAVEIDCDARLLTDGVDEARYGQLLLWVAHERAALPFAPALASPLSHLERRITAMRTRFARPRPLHLLAAGVLAVLAIAGACSASLPDAPSTRVAPQPRATAPQRAPTPAKKDSFFEFKLSQPAQQIPGTGTLRYPAELRAANREGEVLAQFVVDSRGEVEPSTFKVVKSSDPAFTAAVRAALPTMRFTPALVDGRPVKQLVQQPFAFFLGMSTSPH